MKERSQKLVCFFIHLTAVNSRIGLSKCRLLSLSDNCLQKTVEAKTLQRHEKSQLMDFKFISFHLPELTFDFHEDSDLKESLFINWLPSPY